MPDADRGNLLVTHFSSSRSLRMTIQIFIVDSLLETFFLPATLYCNPKAAQEDAQERIYHQSQDEQTAEHAVVIEIES